MNMGALSYCCLLLFSLTICRTNGFTMAKQSMFNTVSSSGFNQDSDFSVLQENTIADLGLKLAQKMKETSARNCFTACTKSGSCVRSVFCKAVPKCLPGHFCTGFRAAGTCYLSDHSGETFQPAGTCSISKEVGHQQIGILVNDAFFSNQQFATQSKEKTISKVTSEKEKRNKNIPKHGPVRPDQDDQNKIPNFGCHQDPTYINHGAVEQQRLERPGYPVVIEYQCDQEGEEKYQYLAGSSEALCDDQGDWTLPAMICIPTSCYHPSGNGVGRQESWYVGDKDQNREGLECQRWRDDSPHGHDASHKWRGSFLGESSVPGAKCRVIGRVDRPWCYTKDPGVRWSYCDVPKCKEGNKCDQPPYIYGTKPLDAELIGQELHVTYACQDQLTYESGGTVSTCDMETGEWTWSGLQCYSKECFFYEKEVQEKGVYQGNLSTTVGGKTCQRWDSQSPHDHEIKASYFPVENLSEAGNWCRDFKENRGGAPWCYTTDPLTRWEFCDVPECSFK